MEPNGGPPRKSSNFLVIILVAVVGGGFALLLCCGGCGFWFYRMYSSNMPAAEASANAFLDDLQDGRIEAAYASTSMGFQAATNLNQFRDFAKQFPALTMPANRNIESRSLNSTTSGKQATFKIVLNAPNNGITCTVIVTEENGQWKVLRFNVP